MSESARNSLFQEILIEKNFSFETRERVSGADGHRRPGKVEYDVNCRLLGQLLQGCIPGKKQYAIGQLDPEPSSELCVKMASSARNESENGFAPQIATIVSGFTRI